MKVSTCDECESEYYSEKSEMAALCPECSYHLYGYTNCSHEIANSRCVKCYWNGVHSKYVQEKINAAENTA